MGGSIQFLRQRNRYYVQWYHQGKTYKIYRYNGLPLYHKDIAKKLLAVMQGDVERGVFRIEKFTQEQPTDVIPWLAQWLKEDCITGTGIGKTTIR